MKKGVLLVSILLVLTLFTILSVNAIYEPQASQSDSLELNSQQISPQLTPLVSDILNGIQDYAPHFPEEPRYNGFIVSFPEEPVLLYQKNLNIEVKPKNLLNLWGLLSQPDEITVYKNNLIRAHDSVKQRFSSDKVGTDFYGIYNGLVLYITESECNKLVQQGLVQACYKNYEVKAMLDDSVPLIKADQVWKLKDGQNKNITGQGITIAIIDTGVDYTHPDLQGKIIRQDCYCMGYPGYRDSCCPNGQDEQHGSGSAMDDYGHGTHCASIAAGTGEASNGEYTGVAPGADIEAIKVLDSNGAGFTSDIVAGIEKAVQDNVSIISMSLGAYPSFGENCYADILSTVSDNAVDAGVTVVVAAGNAQSYISIAAPGCAKKVITVGASCKPGEGGYYCKGGDEAIVLFSSKGPTNNFWIKPDVVAPGFDICAAKSSQGKIGDDCYQGQGDYVSLSGTSMATPHVAGLIALIKQKNPSWTPQEIRNALENDAVSLTYGSLPSSTNQQFYDILTQGYGRVDAFATVLSPKPQIAILDTGGIVNGTINITGTASGDDFMKFILEYGLGTEPRNWNTITIGNESIINGSLGSFNSSICNGICTIRLTVYSKWSFRFSGKPSQDRTIIGVNQPVVGCNSCVACTLETLFPSVSMIILTDNIRSKIGIGPSACIYLEPPSRDNLTLNCNSKKIIFDSSFMDGGGTGIYLFEMNSVKIKDCWIENFGHGSGIVTTYSEHIHLTNNKLNNNSHGLIIYNPPWNEDASIFKPFYNHDIDTSNQVNGKPVYYYFDKKNIQINNRVLGHLTLAFCSNVTVINNRLDCSDEISLKYVNDTKISNNIKEKGTCTPAATGITAWYGSDILIEKNRIKQISTGVAMAHGKNTIISGNYFIGAKESDTGILDVKSENLIIKNNSVYTFWIGIMENSGSSNVTIIQNQVQSFGRSLSMNKPPNKIIIQHNSFISGNYEKVYVNEPIELSYNQQGNYWGRSTYPYFCEYGNQNASCINNWDSNSPDVIDSYPLNQSYFLESWPANETNHLVCYMEGRTCVDYLRRYPSYCVGNSVHSYLCLNNRCVLNDAIPVCSSNQKCVNGTCVSQQTNLTQCVQYGGVCINAVSCPSGYAPASYSCQNIVSTTSESVTGSGIFDTVTQPSSQDSNQPQIQTICCMKTQIPLQPISITASAIKQFGETYNQVFTKIWGFVKNIF